MGTPSMRRPGGNSSVSRIDKAEHYQTVLYEIDMLRYSYSQIIRPPDVAREADVWAYLESFLVHYRNLLDFFGKTNSRNTDLTLSRPDTIWSVEAGLADRRPSDKTLAEMGEHGQKLWHKYEDSEEKDDTISRYLQHCTKFRLSPKGWYPIEMMSEISDLLKRFEGYLPEFKPATRSGQINRARFLGGESASTHSGG